MRKKKKKHSYCCYCEKNIATENDHIPPKNMFPSPRPNNLITVPCCDKCHKGFSKDDEYFRNSICLRDDISQNENVKLIIQTILRSLERPESRGLQIQLFSNFTQLDQYTLGGLYLGKRGGYSVDLNRINRVGERIFRGIIYKKNNEKRVPDNYKVVTRIFEFKDLKKIDYAPLRRLVEKAFHYGSLFTIVDSIFKYWFCPVEDDEFAALGLMLFYDRIPFICFSVPQKPHKIF